ncbi:hypothetical protein QBC38DRAFT_355000 [Podospora fimiseda]|uniref:Uncharacterized protein n=1 Tax=Podospora fimiseda TaxID=252190 RepID=A0AAN7BXI3_9PEZI|nr:hypothetical protein QBC38DRAFT_355000 [Podospora fimiseda]
MQSQSRSIPIHWDGIPQPLHINKRSTSNTARRGGYQRTPRSRCSSSESDATDASFNSIPEPPGADKPLKILKRRGDRSIQMRNMDGATYSPQGHTQIIPAPQNNPPLPPAIPPRSNHRPRRSTSCNPEHRILLGRRQVFDGNSDRDDVSRLRAAKSMFHITRRTNEMEIGMDSLPLPPRSPMPQPEPDLISRNSSPEVTTAQEPSVLVPRIVVTPENKALDEGTGTLWATVQISTQISRASAPEPIRHDDACGWVPGHSQELSPPDVFGYGCLYDVSVEILPTSKSAIIELVDDEACAKSTLYPGSRLLLVAHIRLLPAAVPRSQNHQFRQSSDDLMEDLEFHLGSTMTEYLQVRMTYRHSGFPQQPLRPANKMVAHDGIASSQTTIQTTVVAVIKRHNSSSPWSPRPRAPLPNPLFEIIASHWGVQTASGVMQRIMDSRVGMARKPGTMSPPPQISMPPSALGYGTTSRLVGPDEADEKGAEEEADEDEVRAEDLQSVPQERSEETIRVPPPPPFPFPVRSGPLIPKRQASLRQVSTPSWMSKVLSEEVEAEAERPSEAIIMSGIVSPVSTPILANNTTTTTPRSSYRLSRTRTVPSLIRPDNNSSPLVEVENSSDTTPTTTIRSSIGNDFESQHQQQRAFPTVTGRRSLGGNGTVDDGTRFNLVSSSTPPMPSVGVLMSGRERDRESGSAKSRSSGGTRSSEKVFTSVVTTTIGSLVPGGVGNGGGFVNGNGRRGGNKKEKEKDKERGWPGWGAWW